MKVHFTTIVWHGNFHDFVIKAFASLGHEVIFFDQGGTRPEKFLQKIISRLPKIRHSLDRKLRARISGRWLRSIADVKPNLVLLMDYATNITPRAILGARDAGFSVFHWVSSPAIDGESKDLLASIRFSTKIFTADRLWMPIIFEKSDFIHLPLAGDQNIFLPGAPKGKKYDVLFVGSFSESWDGFIRAYVLSKVAEKHNVAIFGRGAPYWFSYFPNLESCVVKNAILDTKELNEAYHDAKIVLNLHSTSHKASLSARTYEIALAGAFQLIDDREDLHALFPEDAFVAYRSISELLMLIADWLPKDRERELVASKMRSEVLAHHTWRHRAEKILNSV